MTEKRFTTVELPKPNRWGIWYDGAYLSTYQVCILLNEYVDVKKENEQLKQRNDRQAKQLGNIYKLIEEKDWRALSDIIDDFKRCDEQLKREWRCYE